MIICFTEDGQEKIVEVNKKLHFLIVIEEYYNDNSFIHIKGSPPDYIAKYFAVRIDVSVLAMIDNQAYILVEDHKDQEEKIYETTLNPNETSIEVGKRAVDMYLDSQIKKLQSKLDYVKKIQQDLRT